MSETARKMPITNVAALWRGQATQELLLANGFDEACSDFEYLRRLCICAERSPDHWLILQLERWLSEVHSWDFHLEEVRCKEIWRQTSEVLLLHGVPASWTPIAEGMCFTIPSACDLSEPSDILWLDTLEDVGTSWMTWRSSAEEKLSRGLERGCSLGLHLPAEGGLQKPNLYRAERHLSGEDRSSALWLSQLLWFGCAFCSERNLRLTVKSESDTEDLLTFLTTLSKRESIPLLALQTEMQTDEDFLPFCRLVMQGRVGESLGIMPVLRVR